MARRITRKEDRAGRGRVAQPVWDPVALVANGRQIQIVGQQDGRVLHVEAGIERADADPQLVAGREAPAVAGRYVAAVDPDLEARARAMRVHLEPPRERRIRGRVNTVSREDAAPAEGVNHERRLDVAAVGVDGGSGAA